jgi:hypothetical protein
MGRSAFVSGVRRKHKPAVQRRGPGLAAAAPSDAKIRSGTLDRIAHADFVLVQKPGKSYRASFRFGCVCRHSVDPHRYRIANVWYAVHAFSSGGTMLVRRTDACVRASFISWAVAAGNIDHSNAIVPVAKGAATLVPQEEIDAPWEPELITPSPGARRPRPPMESPAFE